MPSDFPELLSHTIAMKHATLESLVRDLRAMGTPVSMATLSYWQTGRSAPSRASSLRALRNLETLLEVAPGHLTGALEDVDKGVLWGAGLVEDGLQRTLAEMGLAVDRGLVKLVLHDTLFVDEQPDQHRRVTRQLMRAVSEDVHRLPVVTMNDPTGNGQGPVVEALNGCHIGDSTKLEKYGVTVVEIVLQRPLLRSHETQIAYQITWPHTELPTGFDRQVRMPVHYLALEARFQHHVAHEVRYEHSPLGATENEPSARIPLPDGRNPQFVGRNLAPGTHSLNWSLG